MPRSKRFVSTGYLPDGEVYVNPYPAGYLGSILLPYGIFIAYDTDGVPYLTGDANYDIVDFIKGDKGVDGLSGDMGPVIPVGNVSGTVNLSSYTLGSQTFSLTATGNITFTPASLPVPVVGKTGSISVRIKQDATGSRLLTLDPAILSSYANDPTLTTTANAVDVLTFFWTGTEWVALLTGAAVA